MPLGVDFDGNTYWNFSFYRGLVVEVKTKDEAKSK
jgi:hypothetical protein